MGQTELEDSEDTASIIPKGADLRRAEETDPLAVSMACQSGVQPRKMGEENASGCAHQDSCLQAIASLW